MEGVNFLQPGGQNVCEKFIDNSDNLWKENFKATVN